MSQPLSYIARQRRGNAKAKCVPREERAAFARKPASRDPHKPDRMPPEIIVLIPTESPDNAGRRDFRDVAFYCTVSVSCVVVVDCPLLAVTAMV